MSHRSINNTGPEATTASPSLSKTVGDFFRRRGVLLALLTANCTPGAVGKAVRPDDPTAARTMDEGSCAIPEDYGNPLIVDWKDYQRDDLEIAMKRGVVVVSYDCKTLRILPDCTVDSSYGFMPTSTKERVVQLVDRDELQANLPTFGSGIDLGAGMGHGTTLDIALVTVGRAMTTRSTVSHNLLAEEVKGKCEGASHFVRGVTIGAFSMQTGSEGQIRTAAHLFGAGVSADSSSEKKVSVKNGNLEVCKKATTDMTDPPSGCNAPVRLHLTAIGKDTPQEDVRAMQEACPEGLVMSEGKCTKKKEAPHQCKEDVKDCTAQCEGGHMGSCHNLGVMYAKGKGLPKDDQRAAELYKKACDGGDPMSCHNLGLMYYYKGEGVPKDDQRAAEFFKKACDVGDPKGCNNLGTMYRNGEGVPENDQRAVELYKKACDGGEPMGCSNLGIMYRDGEGVPKDDQRAAELHKKACDGGDPKGCNNLGTMYRNGEGVPENDQRAVELYKKACDGGLPLGCYSLGIMYARGEGVPKDDRRAAELHKKACDMGFSAACSVKAF